MSCLCEYSSAASDINFLPHGHLTVPLLANQGQTKWMVSVGEEAMTEDGELGERGLSLLHGLIHQDLDL